MPNTLYTITSGTDNSTPSPITSGTDTLIYDGQQLARRLRNKSATERAYIAARDDAAGLVLLAPTSAQLAVIYNVSLATLKSARARMAERDRYLAAKAAEERAAGSNVIRLDAAE